MDFSRFVRHLQIYLYINLKFHKNRPIRFELIILKYFRKKFFFVVEA